MCARGCRVRYYHRNGRIRGVSGRQGGGHRGTRVLKPADFDLREVFQYINETALFKNQWQLKTASQEDYARLFETKYRPILKDLEEEAIAGGWLEPKVVYGYFGAQGEGNDVIVYNLPEGWKQGDAIPAETLRFTFPRQREGRGL